jgi:DNA-binding GntR family transcriptional regulator
MQIAAALRERIDSGELTSGMRMPGTRAIKTEFSTSIETAQKALRVLEQDGLIEKWPGVGYYVIARDADD